MGIGSSTGGMTEDPPQFELFYAEIERRALTRPRQNAFDELVREAHQAARGTVGIAQRPGPLRASRARPAVRAGTESRSGGTVRPGLSLEESADRDADRLGLTDVLGRAERRTRFLRGGVVEVWLVHVVIVGSPSSSRNRWFLVRAFSVWTTCGCCPRVVFVTELSRGRPQCPTMRAPSSAGRNGNSVRPSSERNASRSPVGSSDERIVTVPPAPLTFQPHAP